MNFQPPLPALPTSVSENIYRYRVFQKSVPEPSSSGAALFSEVSMYPKVAKKKRPHQSIYLSNSHTKKIHIMFKLYSKNKYICTLNIVRYTFPNKAVARISLIYRGIHEKGTHSYLCPQG